LVRPLQFVLQLHISADGVARKYPPKMVVDRSMTLKWSMPARIPSWSAVACVSAKEPYDSRQVTFSRVE